MSISVRYCSLASSSRYGNAYLVDSGQTRILVDHGIPLRRLRGHLERVGCDPRDISAVFITHEHGDHSRAIGSKPRDIFRADCLTYATGGTWRALGLVPTSPSRRPLGAGDPPVRVGDLEILAVPKSHDAREPVGFIVSGAGERLAVVTDLGRPTNALREHLADLNHYIIESNYDVDMEIHSARPRVLIDRVMGNRGHLSNRQAADLLATVAGPSTESILLAHLSLDCNRPHLASGAVLEAISSPGATPVLAVAPPDGPSPWLGTIHETSPLRACPDTGNYRFGFCE